MFCSECGKQIEDVSVFCTYCGTKTEYTQQVNTAQAAAQFAQQSGAQYSAPSAAFTQTPKGNKLMALRVMSVIGVVWYLLWVFGVFMYDGSFNSYGEDYFTAGLGLSLYALIYGIVVLIYSFKHDMGVVQRLAIINIVGSFLVSSQNLENSSYYWGMEYRLPFFALVIFVFIFTIITFMKAVKGVPVQSVINKPPKAFVITAAAVGAFFFIILSNGSGSSPSASTQTAPSAVLPKNDPKIVEININTLLYEMENNSVLAEQTYKNKTIRTSGYVFKIAEDKFESVSHIRIGVEGEGWDWINVWFKDSERSKILNLKRGQIIAFRAIYVGSGAFVEAVLE